MQRLMASQTTTSSPSEVTRVHQQQQRDAGITMATHHRRSSSLTSSAASAICLSASSTTSPKRSNGVPVTVSAADVSTDLRRHSVGYTSLAEREDGSSPLHNGTATATHNGTGGRLSNDVISDIPVPAQAYSVKANGVTYTPSHSRTQSLERNGLTYTHADEDTRRRSLEIVSDVSGRRQGRGLRLVEGFVVGEGDRVLLALARSRSVDCSKASEGVGGYRSSPPPPPPYHGDDSSGRQDSDGSPAMSSSSSHVMRLQLRQLGAKCDTLQRDLDRTKRELACCLGNIRTFWSPELKKARAARHDEMSRNSSLAQQLLTCQDEVQRLRSLLEKLKTDFRTARTDSTTSATVASTKRTRGHTDSVSPRTHSDTRQRDKETSDNSDTRTLRKSVDELNAHVNQLRDALSERNDTIGKLVTLLNNVGCMSSSSSSTRLDSAQNSDV